MNDNILPDNWRNTLVALDLETTGLRCGQGDRVIEVGISWPGVAGPQVWSRLVNPGKNIRSTVIHGISDEMVVQAPRFSTIAQDVFDLLHNRVVVLHNAKVDLAFLRLEFGRCGVELPTMQVLDTFGLSRHIEGLTSRSLGSLCQRAGIDAPNHRAGEDARATLQLCEALLHELDPEQTWDLAHTIQLCQRHVAAASAALERQKLREALTLAMAQGTPITIRYQSVNEITTRSIVVHHLTSREVHAYCSLRQDNRIFRIDRLALIEGLFPESSER